MNFLEAHRILTGFTGGTPLDLLLGTSGTPDKLDVFLRAAAARRGYAARVRTLPFNTLGQALLSPNADGAREVFVLLPWDFVPESDWRSGLPTSPLDDDVLRERARATARLLSQRPNARLLYLPAPIAPLFPAPAMNAALESWITSVARSLGARVLPSDSFSLASYLSDGSAFAGRRIGAVAEEIIDQTVATPRESCKVLVTDLDNVMWHGVIGEDGLDGIRFGPEGIGYRFFVYQTLLAKLKREGVLLAAVSRNDEELALSPFRTGRMTLGADDFVTILASYNAKSAQIASIAAQLNLGLESFVFVDDNPIELAEVAAQLPAVRCVRFPEKEDELPALFEELVALFARPVVTNEDRERTEMYRRRLQGIVPSDAKGADLSAFLRDLGMNLIVHDRSTGDRVRAVQLINKTNQFNLNGRRVTDDEVSAVLEAGGRLYGASMSDRNGAHGEILACLISPDGIIRSMVLSCRVFQRRVEHAFLAWLAARAPAPSALEFAATPRNEPIRQFLEDPAFTAGSNGMVALDAPAFATAHAADVALFSLTEP